MAQIEREYYLDCIHKAEDSIANEVDPQYGHYTFDFAQSGQAEDSIANEVDPQYGHYTFDFAQSVHVPYDARQVGPLDFKSPLKLTCSVSAMMEQNSIIR